MQGAVAVLFTDPSAGFDDDADTDHPFLLRQGQPVRLAAMESTGAMTATLRAIGQPTLERRVEAACSAAIIGYPHFQAAALVLMV